MTSLAKVWRVGDFQPAPLMLPIFTQFGSLPPIVIRKWNGKTRELYLSPFFVMPYYAVVPKEEAVLMKKSTPAIAKKVTTSPVKKALVKKDVVTPKKVPTLKNVPIPVAKVSTRKVKFLVAILKKLFSPDEKNPVTIRKEIAPEKANLAYTSCRVVTPTNIPNKTT